MADSQKTCQLTDELLQQMKQEKQALQSALEAAQTESHAWRDHALLAHQELRKDYKEVQEKHVQAEKNISAHYAQELSATRHLMECSRHDFIAEIANFKVSQDKLTQQLLTTREEKQALLASLTEWQKDQKIKEERIHTLETQNQHLLQQIQQLTQAAQGWSQALNTEREEKAEERHVWKEEIMELLKKLPQQVIVQLQDKP